VSFVLGSCIVDTVPNHAVNKSMKQEAKIVKLTKSKIVKYMN